MQALPVVAIISLFLGMVMTLQAAYMLDNPIVPKSVIATVVRDSMLLEIATTYPPNMLSVSEKIIRHGMVSIAAAIRGNTM